MTGVKNLSQSIKFMTQSNEVNELIMDCEMEYF